MPEKHAANQPPSALTPSSAHEINNPLDSLLNLLQLVKNDPALSQKSRHYLALAEEEVRRIALIARETLDRYRVTEAAEATNVAALLEQVLEIYRARFQSKGIKVLTRYQGVGNSHLYAGQLRQIFSNLLLNAVDAMPYGGTMHVRARDTSNVSNSGTPGVKVTIADNGCGISRDNLPLIFDRFFTTKGSKGSGMGLAVVKEIIEKHKGELRVRSSTRIGQSGSVFTVFLAA